MVVTVTTVVISLRPLPLPELPRKKLKELERRAAAGDLDALSTIGLAQELNESNVLALYRFVHLFGRELIEAKVKESQNPLRSWSKARAKVPMRQVKAALFLPPTLAGPVLPVGYSSF